MNDDLPDGTGGGGREIWARVAEISLDRAAREDRETWAHRFDLATAQVLAETSGDRLWLKLVRVQEVCRQWQLALERRHAEKERRHAEKVPE